MADFVQGDSGKLSLNISDGTKVIDLTNATVTVSITYSPTHTGTVKNATITDAVNGKCEIALSSNDLLLDGIYIFQAQVKFSDGSSFSSNVQKFTVDKKLGFIPVVGANGNGGNVDIVSGNNGHILVNGLDVKVYDDTSINNQINNLISPSVNNGNIKLNGNEFKIYDDTSIKNTLNTKADTSSLTGLVNTTDLNSGLSTKADKVHTHKLSDITDVDLTNNDTGYTLLYDANVGKFISKALPTTNNSSSLVEYVTKDSWETTGTRTFGLSMNQFHLNNTGSSNLTFTINGLTITVKASETFDGVFDPFIQVVVNGTSTFNARVDSLKTGSSNPEYSIKDYFEGTSNATRLYSSPVNGIIISNDGNSPLTYNVNGVNLTLYAGEFDIKYFDKFTEIAIYSSVPYRICALGLYLTNITGSYGAIPTPLDTVPPVITSSGSGGLFNSAQNITLTANEPATIYYTIDGSTPTISSTVYTSPINISSGLTLKYFGVDTAGNVSEVNTETYNIDTIPPTVSVAPNGGLFNSNQSIVITSNEPATIYYTTNGATPDVSSTVYSAPILVNSTTTLKYFAVDNAGNSSAIQSVTFTIDTIAPTVTSSISTGTFNSAQTVILSANEPATIYYTVNGNTPTTSSTVYNNPISISSTTILKYFAVDNAGNVGTIQTQTYTIDTVAPTVSISPVGGLYNAAQNVTITASETATIYYTLDGSTPTTSSLVYSTALTVSNTQTIKYFAVDTAGNVGNIQSATFTIDTVPPVITIYPVGGLYNTSKIVTLTSNESATIHYTLDGSTPTTSSSVYTNPITINATTTIKYFGNDDAGNSSSIQSVTFTIDTVAPTVTASPSGGNYASSQSVTLTASETATIYYTLDGSTPTTSSSQYSSNLTISSYTTLKYFAVDTAGNVGNIQTQTYTISTPDTTPPVISVSPAGGLYNSTQTVTLSANETSTIYYTIDGSTPNTSSTVYSAPFSISSTTTLKYYGVDTSSNVGNIQSVTYTIDTVSPTITASPVGGTYTSYQSVTLSSDETATIYYTTDGSTPTTSSTVYSSPINIGVNETLKYFGVDTAGNVSATQSQSYVIQPANVTNLAVGTVASSSVPLTWTLSPSPSVANYEVDYSTDGGSNWTLSSNLINSSSTSYTVNGLNASTNYTFRVITIDTNGNKSTGVTISTTTAAPSASVNPVTNLVAGTVTSTTIPLTWTASTSPNIANYEVAHSTDGNNFTVDTSTVTGTSFTVSNLSGSTTYTLRVVAIDTSGNRSSAVTITSTTAAYAEVTNLSTTSPTDTNIHLAWTKPANATSFQVYINGTLATTTTSNIYDPNNLNQATLYTFKVVSVYAGGTSNGVTIQAATKPTTVSNADVVDSFNRADQTVLGVTESGHYWYSPQLITNNSTSVLSTLAVKNNQAYNNGGSSNGTSLTTNTKSDNLRVYMDVIAIKSGVVNTPMLNFRQSDTTNYWAFQRVSGNQLQISKYINNVQTIIGQYSYPWSTTTLPITLYVELRGTYIYCYANGTLIFAVNDSFNQSAQYHGISLPSDASGILDNFKIQDVTSLTAPSPDTTTPTEVSNVVASPQTGGTSIKMTWTGSSDAYSYDIYVNGILNKTVMQIMNGGTTSQNYTITGLTSGTTYSIQIKAKDGFGNTTAGVSVSSTTL